jgi:hypothetical protein
MASALSAAAAGKPCGTPAYVADAQEGGAAVWRYAVAEGGDRRACPPATGDGTFTVTSAPKTVVAVVGVAHVKGVVAAWEAAGNGSVDTSLLEV